MKNVLTLCLLLILGCTETQEPQPGAPEKTDQLIIDLDKLADYLIYIVEDKLHTELYKVNVTLDFFGSYSETDRGVLGIYDFPNYLYRKPVTNARVIIKDLEEEVE